jgi:hypothetical protein
VVVGEQRAAKAVPATTRAQVVRGAQDRVVRVADGAAEAVRAPGRGQELHRPLRARGTHVAVAVEVGLDEVDRGQDVPGDAEAALTLVVEAAERRWRQGRAGADWARPRGRRAVEAKQRAQGSRGLACAGSQAGGQGVQHLGLEPGLPGQDPRHALLVERA